MIDLGNRRELFVDSRLIHSMEGAQLRLHHPECREVVMELDRAWEGNTCGYVTVFQDGAKCRMYYRGSHYDQESEERGHPPVACYAESEDGIHWARPDLGLVEFDGSKENNIVWDGPGVHNFTPFKDPNPGAPETERYKAVARHEGGLITFRSSDAIRWSRWSEDPVITDGAFDSQNLAFWDPVREEYRCYFRDFHEGVRDIKTCVSDDFLNWSDPCWLEYPGAPHEHLYTNQIMPCPRAPHLFIGFPTRYLPDRGQITEGLFMSSRDGVTFRRRAEAFVRPGLNADKWGNRCNYIWWGLLETESDLPGAPDEFSLYTDERYYTGPGAKVRRHTIRKDGFLSLNAPMSGGTVVTKPLTFEGSRLELNVSTSAAGSVRVELQDHSGEPMPGYCLDDCPEIYGDDLARLVEWQDGADLADLAGQPLRLHIELRDADLYSLRFRQA